MGYRLALHQHVAIIGDRAILLDTKADRYCAFGPPAAAIFADLAHSHPDTPGVAALLGLGIIEPGSGVDRTPALHGAATSALEMPPVSGAAIGLWRLSAAMARASLSLKTRGLGATLAMVSRPNAMRVTDPDQLIAFAQAYAATRAYLPFRHICLPDSLAMHHLLTSRGCDASLVIGVRLNPFGAHCWVQAKDMVLNDRCDTVSGFTPILAL